ncbi:pollen-specific leucine-rich repeat extensin-like protein 4 [Schistocerca americana]|uniref:pollen-specific leucine-rich repeat extensin-like protein 4 n=1 Tax=Schistocerca americana TaxID=7009 RepID=UPI001F4F1255|nr:pollen-specific leucine-rich repeat extensin-like protein 4 [Schistocerca americana]
MHPEERIRLDQELEASQLLSPQPTTPPTAPLPLAPPPQVHLLSTPMPVQSPAPDGHLSPPPRPHLWPSLPPPPSPSMEIVVPPPHPSIPSGNASQVSEIGNNSDNINALCVVPNNSCEEDENMNN